MENDIAGLIEKAQCIALETCVEVMARRDAEATVRVQAAQAVLGFINGYIEADEEEDYDKPKW